MHGLTFVVFVHRFGLRKPPKEIWLAVTGQKEVKAPERDVWRWN
jgi:hypothetical protein